MALISPFSEQTFTDFFKNNLKLKRTENLKYHIKTSSRNEKILYLEVTPENEEMNLDHILIKMFAIEDVDKKMLQYANSLKNVFTVQDNDKNVYFGFDRQDVSYPDKNNLENLNTILKCLAEFQANNLAKAKSEGTRINEDKVKTFSDVVLSLSLFEELNEAYKSDVVSRLQQLVDKLSEDGFLVKSVGSVFANNVFITASDKCVFLDLGREVFRSPLYDALVYIFAFSDENFRQHNLKTLLRFYYQTFIKFVKKIDSNVEANFNINVFEYHTRIVLSMVKFEMTAYLIQKEKTTQEQKCLKELLKNILFSLKYEQISYEDCLEVVTNKLGTTDFELINYQLTPLDEKNGHVGQYFSLKSTVNFSNKTQEFNMFTKILRAENSYMNTICQSGISEKEQFFYRTLIPLFKKYGLEDLVDFAPTCYFDRLNDVVVLDDLVELGYKSFKTNTKFGYNNLKSAFAKAARLQAGCLILEERMSESKGTPERIGDIYNAILRDYLFETHEGLPKSPVCAEVSKPGLDQLIDSFDDVPKDITKEEFRKRVDAIYGEFLKRINTSERQFRNVICHGDLYASNILIKYDQNGMPENSFIVDFQGLRYAPITEDILMLAYFSTEKDVRDKYLDKLLEEYYEELGKILNQFNLDVDLFYTPAEFTECVKYMKPAAILAATFYGQIIALSPEKREKIFFNESNFMHHLFENRKEYVRSIISVRDECSIYLKGLIEDLYDICISPDYDLL